MSKLTSSFIRRVAFACLLNLAVVVPATAGDCDLIDGLDSYADSGTAPKNATCSLFRTQTGGTGVSCSWAFPFRDAQALSFAEATWANVKACRVGRDLGPDALVNHPDSYDLRTRVADKATYRVSVKDKGALQKTLVFLRIER